MALKEKGNALFKAGKPAEAIGLYQQALAMYICCDNHVLAMCPQPFILPSPYRSPAPCFFHLCSSS